MIGAGVGGLVSLKSAGQVTGWRPREEFDVAVFSPMTVWRQNAFILRRTAVLSLKAFK